MAKHLTTREKLTKDPWIVAIIVAEIAAVCFLLVAIPGLADDAETLGRIVRLLVELAAFNTPVR